MRMDKFEIDTLSTEMMQLQKVLQKMGNQKLNTDRIDY
jgi:hypothetical protein